jgi:hypothetical protein
LVGEAVLGEAVGVVVDPDDVVVVVRPEAECLALFAFREPVEAGDGTDLPGRPGLDRARRQGGFGHQSLRSRVPAGEHDRAGGPVAGSDALPGDGDVDER